MQGGREFGYASRGYRLLECGLFFYRAQQFGKARDKVSFRNVCVFDESPCLGFGDSVEIPSEVLVQCLFSLERGHLNHLKLGR
jgi:hypothetical protein